MRGEVRGAMLDSPTRQVPVSGTPSLPSRISSGTPSVTCHFARWISSPQYLHSPTGQHLMRLSDCVGLNPLHGKGGSSSPQAVSPNSHPLASQGRSQESRRGNQMPYRPVHLPIRFQDSLQRNSTDTLINNHDPSYCGGTPPRYLQSTSCHLHKPKVQSN